MVCLIEAMTVNPFPIRASTLNADIASRLTSKRRVAAVLPEATGIAGCGIPTG
jgi:hypothetical protein